MFLLLHLGEPEAWTQAAWFSMTVMLGGLLSEHGPKRQKCVCG